MSCISPSNASEVHEVQLAAHSPHALSFIVLATPRACVCCASPHSGSEEAEEQPKARAGSKVATAGAGAGGSRR